MDGQTIFSIIVGVALGGFSLVMVGYAFFRANAAHETPIEALGDDEATPSLAATLDAIATLELEYQLGNVPEGQYRELLDAYRLQAAHAVRLQLERRDAPDELLLEGEVLLARATLVDSRDAPLQRDESPAPVGDVKAADADSPGSPLDTAPEYPLGVDGGDAGTAQSGETPGQPARHGDG